MSTLPPDEALILVAESGENSIVVVPGANELCPPDRLERSRSYWPVLEVPLDTVESIRRSSSGWGDDRV